MAETIKKYLQSDYIAWFGCLLIAIGLPVSNAMVSIGSILIFLGGITAVNFSQNIKKFAGEVPILLLASLLLISVLSGFWSDFNGQWWESVRVKLPLLFSLYGLLVVRKFDPKMLRILFWGYAFVVLMVAILSFGNYLLNFTKLNELVRQGKQVPIITGRNHIYFSILLSMNTVLGFWLVRQKEVLFKREKMLAGMTMVLSFILLHFLAARTGLIAVYCALGVLVPLHFIRQGQAARGIAIVAFLVMLPFFAYFTVPSLQNRIKNTYKDLVWIKNQGDPNWYSIAARVESYKMAVLTWKDYPVLGAGFGNVDADIEKKYEANSMALENFRTRPHSQFFILLAATGTLGVLIFLGAWISPFFDKKYRKSDYFLGFWLVFFLSMISEFALERQIGVMILVFFWGLFFHLGPQNQEK